MFHHCWAGFAKPQLWSPQINQTPFISFQVLLSCHVAEGPSFVYNECRQSMLTIFARRHQLTCHGEGGAWNNRTLLGVSLLHWWLSGNHSDLLPVFPTFFRFSPRKSNSAWLWTDTSSAWNQVQIRWACNQFDWWSKNLYSASWYFTHSLLPVKKKHSWRDPGVTWYLGSGNGSVALIQ